MASTHDLSRLREQAIGANVDEEAVTVNTRALIDKVLARYSGDWTTLRELIQNAADASASKVIIRFETMPSKSVPLPSSSDAAANLRHTVQHHTVERLIVSNNGQPFNQNDWNRLKRIAEGNPDETKIGAFGVGFYSVFADCEEPFVISGDRSMAFYWKGNSLFTKAGSLPAGTAKNETTFVLNNRNLSSPVPDLMSVCQFLSTSLTFVGVEAIEFWLDQWRILDLRKKQAPGEDVKLPSDVKRTTKEKMMKVTSVTHQSTQIDAQWLNVVGYNSKLAASAHTEEENEDRGPSLRGFFYRLTESRHSSAAKKAAREAELVAQQEINANIAATSQATAFLRISTVNVQTAVSSAFSQELERATKKPPPKNTRIAILTSSHEEATASLSTSSGITASKATEMFASVVPTKHGRIFIGFPTSQTTGLLCHISAPSVIPTVERESIDLNARYVRTWNVEMLRVAGIACRIAFSGEMVRLRQRIEASAKSAGRVSISSSDVEPTLPAAIHTFKQYTASESTPSAQVGKYIEEAFWECSDKGTIDVISTKGVLPSSKVRLVAEPLSFLGEVPLIPADVASGAEGFVRTLYDRGLVSDMTIKDIRTELEARPLSEEQFIEFLKWASSQYKSKILDDQTIGGLFESVVVTIPAKPADAQGTNGSSASILVVGQIQNYISGSKIPVDPDLPLPQSTLPFRFSRVIPLDHLKAFGFEELQVVPWIRYLVEAESTRSLSKEQCITQSPDFAAKVLTIVSKQWDHVSQGSKATLIELLGSRPCFPTKNGMRLPAEAYFPTVKLFEDLPRVVGLGQVRDKVLIAFGVRKTIELNYVFDRLLQSSQRPKNESESGRSWSFVDLIQYLVSVQTDIPKKDIERLRTTAICPKEDDSGKDTNSSKLYKVSELYEPKDVLRKLGLPILQWPGYYRLGSPEARFLTMLGVRNAPTMPELIQIMMQAGMKNDLHMYNLAFTYFRENYVNNGYAGTPLDSIRNMPFLLVEGKDFPALVAPSQCFANEKASIMGYTILRSSLQLQAIQFGVSQHPPIGDCARRLVQNPPGSKRDAIEVFGYFAGRLAEINGQLASQLGDSLIVPISSRDEKRPVRFGTPKSVFLGESDQYGDILDFVDFGMEANSFLLKVGSKHEPTSVELARMVAEGPARILGVLGDTKYLGLLRKLAENQTALKNDKALWKQLKTQPCLLAYKESAADSQKHSKHSEAGYDDDEEDLTVKVFTLRKAPDIVIADSIRELIMFREYIAQAPQDDTLEAFYQELGVPLLSSLADQSQRIGNVQRDQSEANKIRKLIVERSRLFLSEYSSGVRHDSKWLDQSLTVSAVDSLSLAYTLRGYNIAPIREKRTASMSAQGKTYALHIVKNPDMYEVATWICRLLLTRPKQHDTLALETVLESDLRRLRIKGYNIDRILRQRDHDIRLADEQRKRQQEEELKMAEQRRQIEAAEAPPPYQPGTPAQQLEKSRQRAMDVTPQHKVPGAFGSDSPDHDEPSQPQLPLRQPPKGTDIFSSAQEWAKSFGQRIQGTGTAQSQSTTSLFPPPSQGTGSTTVEPKSSERNVAQNLSNAVKSCRSHTSNDVFSPPSTTNVEEAKGSYCDSTPAQDISFVYDSPSGIKVFLANHISDRASFVASHAAEIASFGGLLLDIASIFGIRASTVHIFHDNRGATIAFNLNGALFFNFHWFVQLHAGLWEKSRDMRIQAVAYWWIVFCHELAHNLVAEHSAQHSFYAESFAQQYFGRVMARVMQY